jgi:predicted anti-sigma-YlaC factor YlaD
MNEMNVSCEIVKDLLPLYFDDVCSSDSKTMIERHLVTCDSCKSELQTMKESLPINNTEQNMKESETVRKLSKRWRSGMIKSILKGILIGAIIIAAIILLLFLFMDIRIVYS